MVAGSTATEWKLEYARRRLIFVADDGRQGERILLAIDCNDDAHLHAAACWIGEQRQLWAHWLSLEETQGSEALSREVHALLASAAPLDQLSAAVLLRGPDAQSLALALLMADASRKIVARQHRFASAELAEAFRRWYRESLDPDASLNLWLDVLLGQQDVQAEQIDRLAQEQIDNEETLQARGQPPRQNPVTV